MEFILENLKSESMSQQILLLIFLHLIIPMFLIFFENASFPPPIFLSKSQLLNTGKKTVFPEVSTVNNDVKPNNEKDKTDSQNHTNRKLKEDLSSKENLKTEIENMNSEFNDKNKDDLASQDKDYSFENVDDVNDYISKSSNTKVESQPYVRNSPRMIKVTKREKRYAKRSSFMSLGNFYKKNKKHFGTNTSIYIIQSPFKTNSGFEVKVGESTNFDSRVKAYKQYWRNLFNVIAKFEGTVSDEKYIQDLLSGYHISGEFYDLSSTQISAIKKMKTLREFEDYFL